MQGGGEKRTCEDDSAFGFSGLLEAALFPNAIDLSAHFTPCLSFPREVSCLCGNSVCLQSPIGRVQRGEPRGKDQIARSPPPLCKLMHLEHILYEVMAVYHRKHVSYP